MRIHQFSDDDTNILVQDASNKPANPVRKYDLMPCQATQKFQGKLNLGKKTSTQTPNINGPISSPNQLPLRKNLTKNKDLALSLFNFESELN